MPHASVSRVCGLAVWAVLSAVLTTPAVANPGICPGVPEAKVSGGLPSSSARIASGRSLRVLAIGSSTTAGVGAGGGDSYPVAKAAMLRHLLPRTKVELIEAGWSGERAPSAAGRIEQRVAARDVDLVVWQVGTNDYVFGGGLESLRDALGRGIVAARRAGADVVLVDPQHYPGIRDVAGYERHVAAIAEAGRRYGVSVVSRYQWMKQVAQRAAAPGLLAADGFHNNALGHRCLGQGVARVIAGRVAGRSAGAQNPATARGSP